MRKGLPQLPPLARPDQLLAQTRTTSRRRGLYANFSTGESEARDGHTHFRRCRQRHRHQ